MAVDVEGSYFLSDSSYLPLSNIRMSKKINKSCFSMINMPHDGDYRRFFIQIVWTFLLKCSLFPIDNGKKANLFRTDIVNFLIIELLFDSFLINI